MAVEGEFFFFDEGGVLGCGVGELVAFLGAYLCVLLCDVVPSDE